MTIAAVMIDQITAGGGSTHIPRNEGDKMERTCNQFTIFSLILGLTLLPSLTYSQSSQVGVIGIPPDATQYPIAGIGFINMNNGNLHLNIPLRTVKGRNGSPITTSLVYDSSTYMQIQLGVPGGSEGATFSAWASYPGYFPNGGNQGTNEWISALRVVTEPYASGNVTYKSTYLQGCMGGNGGNGPGTGGGYSNCFSGYEYTNWQYIDSQGTVHPVAPGLATGQSTLLVDGIGSSFQSYTTDGSGYWMEVTDATSATVYDLHGNIVYNGNNTIDTNGNVDILMSYDALGRPLTLPTGFTAGPPGYIYVGTAFRGVNEGNTCSDWEIEMETGDSNATCIAGAIQEPVLSSLTLPDDRSYQFQYDDAGPPQGANGQFLPSQRGHYGMLTGITLPTGGQITIQYNTNWASLWPTFNPFVVSSITTPDGTWTVNFKSGYGWTVIAPVNPATGFAPQTSVTAYCTSFCNGKSISTFDGSGTSRTTSIQYSSPGQTSSITTTLDNGQSSTTTYTYWDTCTHRVQAKKEYDFSGNLIRETDVNYFTSSSDNAQLCSYTDEPPFTWNDPYLQNALHIVDIPQSVTVYGPSGSSGTPIAQTVYTYDSTPLSATSGPLGNSVLGLIQPFWQRPIHDDADFGTAMTMRGNPTVIQQMTVPGNLITTKTNYYNILGDIIKSVDGKGYATNFDFTDSWNDASCITSPVFAYPTTVTNALGQQTKTSYNSCDGSVASARDQNDINAGRTGTVYTYDGLQRVTNVSFPDGGSTTTNYGGSATPEVITTTTIATPDPAQISTATLDSLGRTVTTVAPSGATVQTTYDSLGRVQSVSNPYMTIGDPTYGITSYAYDALNRKVHQCQPDNSSTNSTTCTPQNDYESWTYSGNTVVFKDEDGNQWQRTSDALGRLINVVEPGALQTSYTYDALNNLLSVNQLGNAANGDTPRIRTFSYDSLSRLLSAYNPETGTVGYTYDPDSNVHTKTDARGVTTSYSYDQLNRLLSKTYSDGATPLSCYQYDTSTNGIGRLANSWTLSASGTASCSTTAPTTGFLTKRSILAYDAMGRLLKEQ